MVPATESRVKRDLRVIQVSLASPHWRAFPLRPSRLFPPRAGAEQTQVPLTVWRSSPSAAPTERPELHLPQEYRTEPAGKVLDH
ncbi:hypothetical protein AOLI_G00069720 [Acnodon oligacanthus]